MAELRDRKGSENGFKRGIKGSEMRWTGCPEKGHTRKCLDGTVGWMRYEGNELTAEKTFGNDGSYV